MTLFLSQRLTSCFSQVESKKKKKLWMGGKKLRGSNEDKPTQNVIAMSEVIDPEVKAVLQEVWNTGDLTPVASKPVGSFVGMFFLSKFFLLSFGLFLSFFPYSLSFCSRNFFFFHIVKTKSVRPRFAVFPQIFFYLLLL